MPTSNERLAYIELALVPGIGPARLARLREYFGSWTDVVHASSRHFLSVRMSLAATTAIVERDRGLLLRVLDQVADLGGFLLTPLDSDFPDSLRQALPPPALLFCKGSLGHLKAPLIAIVGTRHPSAYGIQITREIATMAAQAGIVVVSGMARGLDAVAHRAAVEIEGRTIGVLGNGLGVVYPASHGKLYEQVGKLGLLVTEYPPGERPNAGSFPMRNRLIAGLAKATVVVEAAERSGALITAEAAVNHGREVLAVPGPISSRTSAGTNALIRDGATPYLEPADLLELFPGAAAPARRGALPESRLTPDQRRIFEALDGVPRSIDGLAAELGLSAAAVLQAISEFQIVGVAERDGDGFRRAS